MSDTERRAVFGSHGGFYIDKDGTPTDEVPEEYQNIKKVDLKEFEEWCKKCPVDRGEGDIDILSIGFWYDEDGVEKYEPAEADYRKICEEGWPKPIVMDGGTVEALGLPK